LRTIRYVGIAMLCVLAVPHAYALESMSSQEMSSITGGACIVCWAFCDCNQNYPSGCRAGAFNGACVQHPTLPAKYYKSFAIAYVRCGGSYLPGASCTNSNLHQCERREVYTDDPNMPGDCDDYVNTTYAFAYGCP